MSTLTCTQILIATLFTIVPNCKQCKSPPVGEWIKREHTCQNIDDSQKNAQWKPDVEDSSIYINSCKLVYSNRKQDSDCLGRTGPGRTD